MEEFLNAIGNFGFPIVVTAYLLIRQERKVEAMTNAIIDNTAVTRELKAVIEKKLS